jgi:hypothetical protein
MSVRSGLKQAQALGSWAGRGIGFASQAAGDEVSIATSDTTGAEQQDHAGRLVRMQFAGVGRDAQETDSPCYW